MKNSLIFNLGCILILSSCGGGGGGGGGNTGGSSVQTDQSVQETTPIVPFSREKIQGKFLFLEIKEENEDNLNLSYIGHSDGSGLADFYFRDEKPYFNKKAFNSLKQRTENPVDLSQGGVIVHYRLAYTKGARKGMGDSDLFFFFQNLPAEISLPTFSATGALTLGLLKGIDAIETIRLLPQKLEIIGNRDSGAIAIKVIDSEERVVSIHLTFHSSSKNIEVKKTVLKEIDVSKDSSELNVQALKEEISLGTATFSTKLILEKRVVYDELTLE
ncbi:MAG: hypothetical protein HYW85_00560 [Deltaproteobacteria bacterium]|nr:hypothetical protein [Deltaproteobacteria bacterium]